MIRPSAICLLALLLLVPRAAGGGPLLLGDTVIEDSRHWSGEVQVDGVVIVRREGELVLEPGTRVSFVPRDLDGDGIGDAELRVEGSLKVQGREDAPVVFTSASPEPGPADWKYLMINHALGATVEWALLEYAYSGIQVHYTRGVFRNLLSRHNVDGFRFSTAPVLLEGSILTGNENGIRFEERGAGADIRGNLVRGNRIGVFAVTKGAGLTAFADNAFEDNSDYNVKLGDRQTADLTFTGNWWGTVDTGAIENGFFDGRREEGLGKVIYAPFLRERPPRLPGTEREERW